jgi:chemotaxis protein CheD
MFFQNVPSVLFLHPGDVAVGFAGDRFETLLGSCVSVLLVSPCFQVASMCHFVHSSRPSKAKSKDTSYANVAMTKMEHLIHSAGFNARLCKAYVFGGGNMFPDKDNILDVGAMNIAWAFNYLNHNNIQVLGSETGENYYRKLAWEIGPSNPCDFLQTVSVSSQ